MKVAYRLLFILHSFVGIGALAGGLAAIINPQKPLGVPVEVLKYSPFNDFFIPGITLFIVIGVGNIFSALMIYLGSRYQGYISSVFSWALVIWIVVQCIMLNSVVFLHILYLVIGLMEAILSIIVLFDQRLFPTNVIVKRYEEIKKR